MVILDINLILNIDYKLDIKYRSEDDSNLEKIECMSLWNCLVKIICYIR